MQIHIDQNYPRNLAEALKILHAMQGTEKVEILWNSDLSKVDSKNSIIFLFDTGRKSLDIATEIHFRAGYRVVAFRRHSTKNFDFFNLSLTVLRLWPQFIEEVIEEKQPYVFAYRYRSKKMKKVRG